MLRKSSWCAVAVVFLLSPARLLAGGPPWLSVPIDGVTAKNAAVCAALLTDKLESQLYARGQPQQQVKVIEHQGQWYATLYMVNDIGLSQIEAALKGSPFAVPRDRLNLWGDVVLQIEAHNRLPLELLADLEKKFQYASVARVETTTDGLFITMNMPYPVDVSRDLVERGLYSFANFAADAAKRSLPPVKAQSLPSFSAIGDVIAKHDAKLQDLRWSMQYACRPVGCVAAPAIEKVSVRESK